MTDTNTDIYQTTTGELVLARQTIFDIADTGQQLAEAKRQATAVTTIIDQSKLSMKIGRSEHVLFEGWATLGAFNGLSQFTPSGPAHSKPATGGKPAPKSAPSTAASSEPPKPCARERNATGRKRTTTPSGPWPKPAPDPKRSRGR